MPNGTLSLVTLALLLLAPQALASPRAGERDERVVATVKVSSEALARGDRLALDDVAEVVCHAGAGEAAEGEREACARLRGVSLGYAPRVGAVREIRREQFERALAAAGFTSRAVRLEVPDVARVRRASQEVPAEVLREAVERAALAELKGAGASARLVKIELPERLEVASGAVEVRASLNGVRDPFAPFFVSVEILVDGRTARRLSVAAQVEAFAPVVVAARDIAAGERLRPGDLTVETRRLERALSLYVKDAEAARGSSARRTLARGEALTRDALAAEIVVRPGDRLRVVGASGRLRVTVEGEARASGRVGDRITVKNVESGVMLQAVVVDEGTVRVGF